MKSKILYLFLIPCLLALIVLPVIGCNSKSKDNNPEAPTLTSLQQALEDQQIEIDALKEKLSIVPFSPAHWCEITELTDGHATVKVYGEGNYPVIVMFHGVSLLTGGIKINAVMEYYIASEMLTGDTILTLVIKPTYTWDETNTIELLIVRGGIVQCCTANVGVSK